MPFEISEELIHYLMNQNKELMNQNAELSNQLSESIDKITELTAQIEALTQTIKELTEKKNKNSSNSSKPPSSDGLNKPEKNKSLREKTNRKQGAQLGHEGHRLTITGKPDEVKTLIPDRCKNCPAWKKCKGKACDYYVRRFSANYDEIIRCAYEMNPEPEKKNKEEEELKKEKFLHSLAVWKSTRERSAYFSETLKFVLITTRLKEIFV